jgi:hypothetical protein
MARKKICCTGQTRAGKAKQKSLGRSQQTNQESAPFICTYWVSRGHPSEVSLFITIMRSRVLAAKRQATQHGCLPNLLGDGEKDRGIEIVYVEEKNICVLGRLGSLGRTNISCTDTISPTNKPRNDPSHLFSLSPRSPQFQQSATPLYSLVYLMRSDV